MLARTTCPQPYVEACRAGIDAQLAAYRDLAVLLDALFVHRTRAVKGKDGHPMNEVRLLARSLTENDGVVLADRSMTLDPERSLLGHAAGDEIALGVEDFTRLAEACFAAIESTSVATS